MIERVTLDQLRILIAVVEGGSFSAAARKLCRVQSAISQSIQGLEDSLGVQLFDRSGRMPVVTEAGAAILKDAERVVRDVDLLKARARTIASVAEPEVSLSIEQVFPSALLIDSLESLKSAFPFTNVTLFTEGMGGPEQTLREDGARLAIYSPTADGGKDIQMEYLGAIPLVVVAAADHPLAKISGAISQDQLDAHIQLAMTDRTRKYRGLMMGSRHWSFVEQYNRLDYALRGIGWCCVPRHIVQEHLDSGALRTLDLAIYRGRPLMFPLYAAYKTVRPLGPATQWLLDDLKQRFGAWIADMVAGNGADAVQIRVTAA